MLLNICKSCQYCLETMYWNCCEERFCFDKKIVTYKLDENVTSVYANGITNMGASLESVVTQQPHNNNHLPPTAVMGREVKEMPIHADKIYEVFSKSLIFREDHELKSKGSLETLDDIETKSEPDYLSDRPNRTKVYFEDEVDSPVTDFEIMFKDELLASYDMFKIDEEEEESKSPDTEEGLTMSVSVKKQDVIKPSTVTLKGEPKMTTPNSIYQYDPVSVVQLPTNLTLPRVESVKGILRQKSDISRSDSVRTLERVDSNRLLKSTLNRVESLKNIDPNKINKVLARVPHRSASFLNIPEHLTPTKPPLMKSKSTVGVTSLAEHELKLSQLPDTPIIRSNNLPRFFADSPSLSEYKGETSLQSIKQKTALMFQENDFSMPRYYGGSKPLEPPPVHESKSMPDLRNPTSNVKASKRLVKLRSKLKPLVIRKSSDERL
ncbi:uncharacterized protein LOC106713386 [Papilio machaon]|uniref:uncharacterized protein LOC106713386 n=1 Tax=Papilio machaon TaxID=76193 RepID=UPI001E6638FD|nr:uncharacterized protein LOC106713386 [Papilio machaon]